MRAAKVDANQAEIVRALREAGASVWITSSLGGGYPDLTVGYQGRTYLLEVKNPAAAPADQRLTPAQEQFVTSWKGHWTLVMTPEQALQAIGYNSAHVHMPEPQYARASR